MLYISNNLNKYVFVCVCVCVSVSYCNPTAKLIFKQFHKRVRLPTWVAHCILLRSSTTMMIQNIIVRDYRVYWHFCNFDAYLWICWQPVCSLLTTARASITFFNNPVRLAISSLCIFEANHLGNTIEYAKRPRLN